MQQDLVDAGVDILPAVFLIFLLSPFAMYQMSWERVFVMKTVDLLDRAVMILMKYVLVSNT